MWYYLLFLTQVTDITKGTGSAYVIKIEPHDNGPLFSELSFYQRKAKPDHGMYVCHKLHKVSFALVEFPSHGKTAFLF